MHLVPDPVYSATLTAIKDLTLMSEARDKTRPRVIVSRRLPEPIETRMAELFDIVLNPDDQPYRLLI
ncbi:hypothetical protein JCM17846_01980 [Iodidimonas nitroreducens]|uniref:Uncharacterized protein n=1 Tax=Iodidimonas nitroreducens TaxID=1236968 RepID=A0A5A7N669_9PROT|nr:hypothetical protein JCM17846_01980 [Iodidimonas nitroreducens]